MRPLNIVYEEVPLGLSPAEAYAKLRRTDSPSFLLESADGTSRTVSYSFLGATPTAVLRGRNGQDLQEVRKLMRSRPADRGPFPFMGGLVGYFSYHLVNSVEKDLDIPEDGYPGYELALYNSGLVYDHSAFKVYHFHPEGEEGVLPLLDHETDIGQFNIFEMTSGTERDEFERGAAELRTRIAEGEAFQVVLSEFEEHRFEGDPLQLYLSLRRVNPSPYMFYLDFGKRKVLGSSPETLVTVRGREAVTYPIAGTRPLGGDLRERMENRRSLLADEKERAEHLMLVDLARNDLGKVSEPGTVEVTDLMRVEEFSHVQHMVSKVRGILRGDQDCLDALGAVFPAGTVTGAPKHRAMRLIGSLERRGRGPYAGAVGYISDSGDLDTAIAIRSAFLNGDRIRLQAGAGIVLDSVPEREHLECQAKLGAMHRSLQLCGGGQ